jgi:hypothetical protein
MTTNSKNCVTHKKQESIIDPYDFIVKYMIIFHDKIPAFELSLSTYVNNVAVFVHYMEFMISTHQESITKEHMTQFPNFSKIFNNNMNKMSECNRKIAIDKLLNTVSKVEKIKHIYINTPSKCL